MSAATSQGHRFEIKVVLWLAVIVLVVPGSLVVSRLKDGRGPSGVTSGPAPPVALPTLDGGQESIPAHRGQPLLVYFWAPSCEDCADQLALISRAAEERPELDLLGVVLRDDPATARPVLAKAAVDWPQALDRDGEAARAFGVATAPAAFFIRPDGTIASAVFGGLSGRGLDRQLERLGA